MEIRTFESILNGLSQMKADLPILDTYFFKDGKLSKAYINKKMKSVASCNSLKSFIDKKVSEYEILSKVKHSSTALCFIHNPFTKNLQSIKGIQALKSIPSTTQVVQLPKSLSRFYSYSLTVSKEGQLIENFSGNSYMLDNIKDIVKTLVSYIEMSAHKQVIRICIQFGLESEEQLWIYNITNCELIESSNRSFPVRDNKERIHRDRVGHCKPPTGDRRKINCFGDKYFLEMISKTNVKRHHKSQSHDFDNMVKQEENRIKQMISKPQNNPVFEDDNKEKTSAPSSLALSRPLNLPKTLHKTNKKTNSVPNLKKFFTHRKKELIGKYVKNKLPLLSGSSQKHYRKCFKTIRRENSLVINKELDD